MIYHKELAHVITEDENCHDLLFASWRPRKSGGVNSSAG